MGCFQTTNRTGRSVRMGVAVKFFETPKEYCSLVLVLLYTLFVHFMFNLFLVFRFIRIKYFLLELACKGCQIIDHHAGTQKPKNQKRPQFLRSFGSVARWLPFLKIYQSNSTVLVFPSLLSSFHQFIFFSIPLDKDIKWVSLEHLDSILNSFHFDRWIYLPDILFKAFLSQFS